MLHEEEHCFILRYKDIYYTVQLDPEDYHKHKGTNWHLANCSRHKTSPKLYVRFHTTVNGKNVYIYLHRVIANALPGLIVDHLDDNSLNCRRENLKLTSVQENARKQNHALQRSRGY